MKDEEEEDAPKQKKRSKGQKKNEDSDEEEEKEDSQSKEDDNKEDDDDDDNNAGRDIAKAGVPRMVPWNCQLRIPAISNNIPVQTLPNLMSTSFYQIDARGCQIYVSKISPTCNLKVFPNMLHQTVSQFIEGFFRKIKQNMLGWSSVSTDH